MPSNSRMLLALPFLLLAFPVQAEEEGPDLSRWQCRLCTFETGTDGHFGLDLGLVFDDAYRFGTGTGLEEEGGYLNADFSLTRWGTDARFSEFEAAGLGTDARRLAVTFGNQGLYRIDLAYDETPFRVNNSGASPFLGIGGSTLSLPTGWQTAGSAALMPDLQGALRPVAIGLDRLRYSLAGAFRPADRWLYELSYRHDERDGVQPFSGGFLTLSSILPTPVDDTTDTIEAGATYTTDDWQTSLQYYGSFYSNDHAALSWQNPFNPLVSGASAGAAAMAPDNDFHQLMLSGSYRTSPSIRLAGHVALGKATQDQALLPYTVNPSISSPALPASSADARIDSSSLNAGARVSGRLHKNLRFNVYYRKRERDNETPVVELRPVVTDVYLDSARRITPFSFEKSEYGAKLTARLSPTLRGSFGGEREEYERDYQEVDETAENSLWAEFAAFTGNAISGKFRVSKHNRNGSGYRPVSFLEPPENPLLRKFNLADRDRDQIKASIGITPRDNLSVTFSADFSSDDYPESAIGLNESDERSYTFDASLNPRPTMSLYGFFTRQALEYRQSGAGTAPWVATGEDRFITGGLTLRMNSEDGRQNLELDYTRSDSRGSNNVASAGTAGTPFPDLESDLETFGASLRYQFRDDLSARFRYMYERYHSRDWTIENVEAATLRNVLALGEDLPNYTQQVLWLGLEKEF